MIVNKPQFDLNKIKAGQVYWLQQKYNRGYGYAIDTPCIVRSTDRLVIKVEYFEKDDYKYPNTSGIMKPLSITIDSIVNGTYKLTPMIKDEPKEGVKKND